MDRLQPLPPVALLFAVAGTLLSPVPADGACIDFTEATCALAGGDYRESFTSCGSSPDGC